MDDGKRGGAPANLAGSRDVFNRHMFPDGRGDDVQAGDLAGHQRVAAAAGPAGRDAPQLDSASEELGRATLARVVEYLRKRYPYSDLQLQQKSKIALLMPRGLCALTRDLHVLAQEEIVALLRYVFNHTLDPPFDPVRDRMRKLQCRFRMEDFDVRLTAYTCDDAAQLDGVEQDFSYKVWIRRHFRRQVSLAELGLDPSVVKALEALRYGLVLITGQHNAGKTTTAYSILDHINRSSHRHILTLEDPVEVRLEQVKSTISQRSIGENTPSFAAGLKQAMRMVPDVLFIGELRDAESAALALSYAEAGQLVIATMHGNSLEGALSRLINMFPASEQEARRRQLAAGLAVGLFQVLAPFKDNSGRMLAADALIARLAGKSMSEVPDLVARGDLSRLSEMWRGANPERSPFFRDTALLRGIKNGVLDRSLTAALMADPVAAQLLERAER